MKINRVKNTARSLLWGMINRLLLLVTTFISRTAVIYLLGTEFLGLGSLFSSILSVLNLVELGFGSALVFSMYKPIAEDDTETICCLINYYKKVYRIIGIIVIILGLAVMPFLKYLISGQVPEGINIYWVYLITLSGTAVTYFMFAYKNCLLMAYQRNDVSSIINGLLCIPQNIISLLILLLWRNYYLYLVIVPIFSALNNIIIAMYVTKKFPYYSARGKLDFHLQKDITLKVKGLFVYKIGNVVSGSADNIVISAFLGLTMLGMYNNYYYIINVLFGFFIIYYNAISAGIGNSIVMESVEKNFSDFRILLFIQGWLVGWCSICLICLYQPFMGIWLGSDLMLSDAVVLCLVVYFYVWKIQDIVNIIKEAAGMWDQDKWRPLVSAGANLFMNLIFVRIWGIYGVILSTVFASLLIGLPWASRVLFKNYFQKKAKIYYILLLKYSFHTIWIGILTYGLCSLFPNAGIKFFLIKSAVCGLLPNLLFYYIYRKKKEFISVKQLLNGKIRKKG